MKKVPRGGGGHCSSQNQKSFFLRRDTPSGNYEEFSLFVSNQLPRSSCHAYHLRQWSFKRPKIKILLYSLTVLNDVSYINKYIYIYPSLIGQVLDLVRSCAIEWRTPPSVAAQQYTQWTTRLSLISWYKYQQEPILCSFPGSFSSREESILSFL